MILLLFMLPVCAQHVTIRGSVVSGTDNEPLIGASVVEKGTTNGTITDVDGQFTLSVSQDAVIQVSYIGYTTQEIPRKKRRPSTSYFRKMCKRCQTWL